MNNHNVMLFVIESTFCTLAKGYLFNFVRRSQLGSQHSCQGEPVAALVPKESTCTSLHSQYLTELVPRKKPQLIQGVSTYLERNKYNAMYLAGGSTFLRSCKGRPVRFCQTFTIGLRFYHVQKEHFAALVLRYSIFLRSFQKRTLR